MNSDITIVSAYFNINRENWKGFSRSDEKYFEYFKGWAHLKNKLIVYVETPEMRDNIIEFRRSLGLAEKTVVNLINSCFSIDSELYYSIKEAASNKVHKKFRLYPNNPEVWNAEYDYIMLMKMWCVSDSVERGQATGMIAWMDFGYNHGGDVLDIRSDFGFEWQYDFPHKINLFLIQDLDDRPIFDIVMSMDTYIMGMMIVGPSDLWGKFWHLVRQSMIELNHCGMIDDDQNIILMAYRKEPEIFNTYLSGWQLPLKQFGGDHLLLAKKNKDSQPIILLKEAYHYFRKAKTCLLYSMRLFKYFFNIEVH